jgi:hypothetical protein
MERQTMSEANIIMLNMRGGCATVEGKVHALFRVNNRRPRQIGNPNQELEASDVHVDQPVVS